MAQCLEQLEKHDPRLVIRVAGFNKFGCNGEVIVRSYFENNYGPVDALLLANSPDARSVLGFILMQTVEDAQRAVADGELHEILPGTAVKLRAFERRPSGGRATSSGESPEEEQVSWENATGPDADFLPRRLLNETETPAHNLQVLARWSL